MRYLHDDEIQFTIDKGGNVEQILGLLNTGDDLLVDFLSISKGRDGKIQVLYFLYYDQGDVPGLDVYHFSSFEPDDLYGKEYLFTNIEEAVQYFSDRHGLDRHRFLNSGLLDEEYRKLKVGHPK